MMGPPSFPKAADRRKPFSFGGAPLPHTFAAIVRNPTDRLHRPHVSYTLSPALAQAAGPAMSQNIIATGLQQLRDKASPYRWYPTLQVGVSYHF